MASQCFEWKYIVNRLNTFRSWFQVPGSGLTQTGMVTELGPTTSTSMFFRDVRFPDLSLGVSRPNLSGVRWDYLSSTASNDLSDHEPI